MPSVRSVSAVLSAQAPPLHFGDHLLPHACTFPSSLPGAPGLATCSGWTSDRPWERSIKRGTLVLGGGGGVSKAKATPKPFRLHVPLKGPAPPILALLGCCRVGLAVDPVPCLLRPQPLGPPGSPLGTHTLDAGVQLGFWTTENLYNSLYIYS